ncbi:hypothetical protein PENSUB_9686 [Penicillium subrubescens]|uniref:Uncharacterized protein n=1 Tax=Penicillium subrubescens TaxID=1316194 RepID=A0A1Q5TC58_9EURO|nr:hypothetical protein PENSUB_9686 [Penicillium subrubescens]
MATDELLLHSVTFVASIFIIGVRTIQLINTRVPGNSVTRTQIWGMVRFGADYLVSDDEHLDVEGSFAWPAAWASQSIFAGMGSSSRGEAAKKQE